MTAPHLKGSNLLPAPVEMSAAPDGILTSCSLRSYVPTPVLDGGQMTRVDYLAMWTAWVSAFTAPTLALYDLPTHVLNATNVWADITQPAGTWYTSPGQTTTLSGPWLNPDGSIEVSTGNHAWIYSGASAAETVYGTAICDTF